MLRLPMAPEDDRTQDEVEETPCLDGVQRLQLRRQQELNQDVAHVTDLAREAGAYFRQLLSEGFKRKEALSLVRLHLASGMRLERPEA